tara:strand:- start:1509 stop:2057 length:549 start_codon:yes stop_codon:yes gene_type:complete
MSEELNLEPSGIGQKRLFENLEIDKNQIPTMDEVNFTNLEKDFLWMRITSWSIFLFILLGFLIIIGFKTDTAIWKISAPWLAFLILIVFIELKGFKIKGYAIRQKDISYKSGLIFFSMTSVPFNRIQHVEVSQGPIARLFDLASVKVYTAGGSTSDLRIGGLKKEEAHRLRDHISHLSSQHA